ncbi:MAG: hypothetical protein AAFV69_14065 [Pseudomonadota bacterium]
MLDDHSRTIVEQKIKETLRHAKYFHRVADAGLNTHDSLFQVHRQNFMAAAIGALVGTGQLRLQSDAPVPSQSADLMKELRTQTRLIATLAAKEIGLTKDSKAYRRFSDRCVEAAIATAVAHGELKAPDRGFVARYSLAEKTDRAPTR